MTTEEIRKNIERQLESNINERTQFIIKKASEEISVAMKEEMAKAISWYTLDLVTYQNDTYQAIIVRKKPE